MSATVAVAELKLLQDTTEKYGISNTWCYLQTANRTVKFIVKNQQEQE